MPILALSATGLGVSVVHPATSASSMTAMIRLRTARTVRRESRLRVQGEQAVRQDR
jgi:hypothetical protein